MCLPIFAFQDIIKLNYLDWDCDYAVLNYHLEMGGQKEVLPGNQIIYYNSSRIEKNQFFYETLFSALPENNVAKCHCNRVSRSSVNGDNKIVIRENFSVTIYII